MSAFSWPLINGMLSIHIFGAGAYLIATLTHHVTAPSLSLIGFSDMTTASVTPPHPVSAAAHHKN